MLVDLWPCSVGYKLLCAYIVQLDGGASSPFPFAVRPRVATGSRGSGDAGAADDHRTAFYRCVLRLKPRCKNSVRCCFICDAVGCERPCVTLMKKMMPVSTRPSKDTLLLEYNFVFVFSFFFYIHSQKRREALSCRGCARLKRYSRVISQSRCLSNPLWPVTTSPRR